MAKYVVPSRRKERPVLILCYGCKTLYSPDKKDAFSGFYEKCPVCGYSTNNNYNTIPLWRYNLIKYWRGLINREQSDNSGSDD